MTSEIYKALDNFQAKAETLGAYRADPLTHDTWFTKAMSDVEEAQEQVIQAIRNKATKNFWMKPPKKKNTV